MVFLALSCSFAAFWKKIKCPTEFLISDGFAKCRTEKLQKNSCPRRIGLRKIVKITRGSLFTHYSDFLRNGMNEFKVSHGFHFYMYTDSGAIYISNFFISTIIPPLRWFICSLPNSHIALLFFEKKPKFSNVARNSLLWRKSQKFVRKSVKK